MILEIRLSITIATHENYSAACCLYRLQTFYLQKVGHNVIKYNGRFCTVQILRSHLYLAFESLRKQLWFWVSGALFHIGGHTLVCVTKYVIVGTELTLST